MKSIVLCADDYGQAPDISRGILSLVQKSRLTAVSCMSTMPEWPEQAGWLKPFYDHVDLGLHFNLTEGGPISTEWRKQYGAHFLSLPKLMLQSLLGQLNPAAIRAECNAQIDRFEGAIGQLPQFLDGHQHVHQFPQIREAILQVYETRLKGRAYIRLINPKVGWQDMIKSPKKWLIYAMGTKPLARSLTKKNIPHNQSFSGIYAFKEAEQYRTYFRQFLQEITPGGLIMCHPGLVTSAKNEQRDSIALARAAEYDYFMSNYFQLDCEAAGVSLSRFVKIKD